MKTRIDPDQTPMPLFALKERYAHIHVPFHRHRRAQLIHVNDGTLTVATRDRRWVIPPQRGVWIAPGVDHRIASSMPFTLTTCYIEPDRFDVPAQGIVAVDALTHALLPEVADLGANWNTPDAERLVAVLFDRLAMLPTPGCGLPLASDGPLKRLTDILLNDPASQESLSALAPRAGLSERTATRYFLTRLGISFGAWRRQLRLQTALAQLGAGATVTVVAFDVGYRDVSSFITAFRAEYGSSPGRMFRRKLSDNVKG
ncbi:helix-turn-helix domain-containing protein [Puniceibacterium sp. IMCC21224]|uniref:AraC family transcriptional regulator n=1 Tax=Puniceibacterium sp. IMCC21224 TaxID=1618204 RepID=UPI00064DFAFD|nr:helix-turn-helix transcriptional regulator [Puniceibacterium sp. IMCC21224]KMK63861.1 DNA-binding domain-containing protein, AraC-type [Puniceibacterium sp. IMCC21224]